MGVEPGARRCAAERDLADMAERRLDPLVAELHLRRVAAELLPERHRHGIHQVGAAGLDDVGELRRLGLERGPQPVHRGQKVVRDLVERREMDGRREDVVGGLTHVHVVVGVGAFAGDVREHLVRVHVRGGARPGLEDVDGELVVVLAVADGFAGRADALGEIGVKHTELTVGAAAAPLRRPSQRTTGTGTGSPETGKFSTALVVSPPQSCSVKSCLSSVSVRGIAERIQGIRGGLQPVSAPLAVDACRES